MEHKGTKRLETERLILRRFVTEDADAMFRNWACKEEVTKYLTWPPHANADATRELLATWISQYENPSFYNWAIELKEIGEVIGNISLVRVFDRIQGADLGYCMDNTWWGKGIMPEAAGAVLKYLFTEVGFNRIAAAHDKNNPKSGRVMQKIGMQYEGLLRQSGFCNQGVIDVVWYSILSDEYIEN